MRAAKSWGLPPSIWDELSDEDKAEMMAVEDVERDMAAWEQEHAPRTG